jgi:phage terminase small subunit
MPVLENPKHERFAQELAKGTSASQAYVLAGYKPNDSHASRLGGNGKVAARVEEILGRAAARAEVSVERVLQELALIAFSNPRAAMSWGPDGVVLRDSAELTDQEAALISEVAETKDGLRVKLHSKLDALGKIGQHLGMFKERVEHTGKDGGPIETKDVSDIERARRVAFMLARAGRKTDEPAG